ncbi:MAG: T9SS type A sorting domain-containing protein, partial [Chitinophagales bacterium]
GTTSISGGYLDNEFISNTDDSLVLLYRANPHDDWIIYPYYTLNVWAIITDKRGAFELSQLQPGEYAFGIYNAALPNAPADLNDCIGLEATDLSTAANLQLFPNPTDATLLLRIAQNMQVDGIVIYTTLGTPVYTKNFSPADKNHTIETAKFPQGIYNVCVTLQGRILSVQKLLIIR